MPMQFIVVVTAERDGEFVAHLAAQCPRLRKFQMMRVARLALADHAWMRSDKDEMGFAAFAG